MAITRWTELGWGETKKSVLLSQTKRMFFTTCFSSKERGFVCRALVESLPTVLFVLDVEKVDGECRDSHAYSEQHAHSQELQVGHGAQQEETRLIVYVIWNQVQPGHRFISALQLANFI